MRKALSLLQQHYQAFQQRLEQMGQAIALSSDNGAALQLEVRQLQDFFRAHILSLPMDGFTPAMQHWVQSYQVECDKQLRLLSLDVMRLQAARQPATLVQRWQQVGDRLGTLQQYCAAVLEKAEE